MTTTEIILRYWNPTGQAIASESFTNKQGKTNFAPVCSNKFKNGCKISKGSTKPCKKCTFKNLSPLTAAIVAEHVSGGSRKGIYPLLKDNATPWVAADLDNHDGKSDPARDVRRLIDVSRALNIPFYVFSSNSGAGYHFYLFFDKPIPAYKARGLLLALLDRARITVSESFDSVFPKQDTLKGLDIGNLIALPWSGSAVTERKSTMYLDPNSLEPYGETLQENADYFNDEFTPLEETGIDDLLKEMQVTAEAPNPIVGKTSKETADQKTTSLVDKCKFLKHCQEDARTLTEPEWYLMVCILAREFGGPALIHTLSAQYSGYSDSETDAKIIHALNDQPAPITCETVKKHWDCGQTCGVTCPVFLKGQQPKPQNVPSWVNELLWGVKEGERETACEKLASYYTGRSDDEGEIVQLLTGWNQRNSPPLPVPVIENIVSNVMGRKGTLHFSSIVGTRIYRMEILQYPDGEVKYNLFVDNDKSIVLEPDDLIQHRRFRTKFMTLTTTVLRPVKDDKWFPGVEGALKEAVVVEMSEDETHLSAVRRLITQDVKRGGDFPDPEKHIDGQAVVYKGRVHLLLDVLSLKLSAIGIKVKSQKEMGRILRKIGFKNGLSRINDEVVRTWHIDLDTFDKQYARGLEAEAAAEATIH